MEESEREQKLAAMKRLIALAEKCYDDMYEAYEQRDVNRCYRDAKDYYTDAIGLAGELGMNEEADRLYARLWHIKEVFFHQFAG